MTVLRITKHGEKVLKTPCREVDYEAIRDDLPKLLKEMWATMYSVNGVGLAAPQIGMGIRLSVIDLRPEGRKTPIVLINPEVIESEGTVFQEEGCLSLPGLYWKRKRAAKVRIRALNAKGRPFEMTGEGVLARAFQHEIDHLNVKLFIDEPDFTEKLKVMEVLKDLRVKWL